MNKLLRAGIGQRRTLNYSAWSLVALLAAGCASTPVPQDKLALAQSSIDRAERADAVALAGVPLRKARDKFAAAKLAADKKDGVQAGRLAEQADVDAQLAEATAQAARSQKAVTDLDQSLRTLSEESQRNPAVSGAGPSTTSGGVR